MDLTFHARVEDLAIEAHARAQVRRFEGGERVFIFRDGGGTVAVDRYDGDDPDAVLAKLRERAAARGWLGGEAA